MNIIRLAELSDLPHIMPIFEKARKFMQLTGNPSQWIDGYPSEEIITHDIEQRNFYVETSGNAITGGFAFITGDEPSYKIIQGEWLDNAPYGTIHRLASDGSRKGFADRCIEFCRNKISTLRADTHKDNLLMQKALLRNGFQYCGIIRVANGTERLAYQLQS